MRPSEPLAAHREAIRANVAAHRGANPRVFGSVARGEDTEQSDLDILIDPSDPMSLFGIGGIQYRLSELLGAEVDVILADGLPKKFGRVLEEAVPV